MKRGLMLCLTIGWCLWFLSLSAQDNIAGTKDSTVVEWVDEVPQFPGGMRGWQQFLRKNLDITDAVRAMDSAAYVDYGMRQTAYLEFTVCEDGKVCDVEIVNKNKISPEFAREAFRVMNKSPKWMPGKLRNKAVRTRFKQSITAVLDL